MPLFFIASKWRTVLSEFEESVLQIDTLHLGTHRPGRPVLRNENRPPSSDFTYIQTETYNLVVSITSDIRYKLSILLLILHCSQLKSRFGECSINIVLQFDF